MATMLLYLFGPREITIGSERLELRSAHVIFMFFSRQDSNGYWSHKPGGKSNQVLFEAQIVYSFFQFFFSSKTNYKQRQYRFIDY